MKMKIILVGPSQAGKTSLTNVLGRDSIGIDSASSGSRIPYYPTRAIRIVDFPLVINGPKRQKLEAEIQLWEIGGDPKLKAIWPGIQRDIDGVIIIYRAIEESHVSDASALHMHFLIHSNSGLSPSQCLLIGNNFRGMRELGTQKIIGVNQRTRHVTLNVEDDTNRLKDEFQTFITGIAQILMERD